MKKTLIYLAIASLSILACSKKDDSTPGPSAGSGVSTKVFYVDTFRIYSTDLSGANRKVVVDEGPNNSTSNNYIGQVSVLPTSQQLVYTYSQVYTQPLQIKTCKFDGADKKVVKTLATGVSLAFIKGTTDGRIIYQTNLYQGGLVATNTYSIKADGTDEQTLKESFYTGYINEGQISNQGKGVLSDDGYFFKIVNGVWTEAESFNVFLNEDKPKINEKVISADATKLAVVKTTSIQGKFEIRIKDLVKNAPTSSVIYTLNIPADANQYGADVYFVNGSKNLLVTYGKFTSPRGSASDYTNCDLIDATTGKLEKTWKFTGDDIGRVIAD